MSDELLLQSTLEAADKLYRENQLEQAGRLYERVCQTDAGNTTAWTQLAAVQYGLGQPARALLCAEQALSADPWALRAHEIRAGALIDLNRLSDAVGAADRLLAIEPRNVSGLLSKSTALLHLGKNEEALAAAQAALDIDAGRVSGYVNRGLALYGLKRYEEALNAFDRALQVRPGYFNAMLNRGSTLIALGRFEESVAVADEVLAVRPQTPAALLNRGAALLRLKRNAEALEAFEKVLSLHPQHLKALVNKGLALLNLERFPEALAAAEPALRVSPEDLGAMTNRARALLGLDRYADALEVCGGTLRRYPADADTRAYRAQALLGLKRFQDALNAADEVLKSDPGHTVATLAKALALMSLGRNKQALVLVAGAAAKDPGNADLQLVLSSLFLVRERFSDALAVVEGVLGLDAERIEALINKAAALNGLGRAQEALESSESLLRRGVRSWQVYSNLGGALSGLERFSEAEEAFDRARAASPQEFAESCLLKWLKPVPSDAVLPRIEPQGIYVTRLLGRLEQGEWSDHERVISRVVELTEEQIARGAPASVEPFRTFSLPVSPEFHGRVAQSRARWIAAGMAEVKSRCGFRYPPREGGRLRIGYVSADFRQHPTAHLMRSLFGLHDRGGFEIYAYSLHKGDGSAYYQKISRDCDHFVDVTELSNREAAERIQADRIDILVDLMGYTRYARPEIFALEPAPIQVSYLGFAGTTSAECMDYVLCDRVVLPPENARFFTEAPVYLPESYQVNDRWQAIASTGLRRADQGLPDRAVVFCCFNNSYKIEPRVFDLWMRILARVPGSVLWLIQESPGIQRNLRKEAEARGVSGDRLIFAARLPKDRHLERHCLADLFLDTLLFNAHTTASDALWAGLPVLTCSGQTFASRVAASLLKAVGLPELVAKNPGEYERDAVYLALHPGDLDALRRKLQHNRLTWPLFDTVRFARHLEQAYRMMWQAHEAGEPPRAIEVPALPR
jgi:protein O-GlcNAc transferase